MRCRRALLSLFQSPSLSPRDAPGVATRRAGATHISLSLLCRVLCRDVAVVLDLWLVVNFACSRPGVRASVTFLVIQVISPPRMLSIVEKVVASSSACSLK